MNIKLILEYDGTNYHGWQWQKNQSSIQGTVEEAIFKLTQTEVRLIAAGRTDAGVHARGQVVNFELKKDFLLDRLILGLNSYLPSDIVVRDAAQVPSSFHSRYDATKRIYQYYIKLGITAVYRHFCWQYFQKIDQDILNRLSKKIEGEHDFSSFSRVQTKVKNKFCLVFDSEWREEDGFLIYRIVANRFLHGMVRTLVGTMLDVARGYFNLEDFEKILFLKDRCIAGRAAPAQGLFLEAVHYN